MDVGERNAGQVGVYRVGEAGEAVDVLKQVATRGRRRREAPRHRDRAGRGGLPLRRRELQPRLDG